MEGTSALLAGTTAFAILVTKVVDFCRNSFDTENRAPKALWNALALVLGLATALIFELNIIGDFPQTRTQGTFGQILTGLGIGATGSGWHEILDALSGAAKKLNPLGAPRTKIGADSDGSFSS